MASPNNSSWSLPWLVTTGAAAFAIGIATSDALRSAITKASMSGETLAEIVQLPLQAQVISPAAFAALALVPPPNIANATTIFLPPGNTIERLKDKPFHIYHPDFLDIIGGDPTLTLIADSGLNPLFHEAVVWYPPTDEVFFAQSAGPPTAGTGLASSSIIQKVSLQEAMAVSHERNATGKVQVHAVHSQPTVINPNGGTNYKGNILFAGEGMGAHIAPALYSMNPVPPYNTSVVVNNYYGRQFNSLNDVAVNPRNQHIYFTDVDYGYLQDFRPKPGLLNQVYRFNPHTKAVTAVADGFDRCNGITFSPDGHYAYVTDTGACQCFKGYDSAGASTIYRYIVASDGTLENRKVFAYVGVGIADGIHCDSWGNVYAGCGDGIHVWNPSGDLLGKIFLGETSANFQLAGSGRMLICAETRLYYATIAAQGAPMF